ncbi:MAG TPA: carboxymuconolactone decarboxylase family protein [Solirubrobacteraceae bacterium]|nr:carboxymuconolactone decarboxylase family protein [Solirubrobacteraceae bacterium]
MTTLTSPRLNAKRAVPEMYRAMIALDEAVGNGDLDPLIQELVKVRASQINGCAYCLNMHTRDALKAGERPERLHVLAGWREAPTWFDDRERAALAFTEAVTRIGPHGVPDEIYDAAAEQFSEAELGALLFLVMVSNAWNRLAVTSHISP